MLTDMSRRRVVAVGVLCFLLGGVVDYAVRRNHPELPPGIQVEQPKAGIADITSIPKLSVTKARRTALHVWGRTPCQGHGSFTITLSQLRGRQVGQANYQYNPRVPADPRFFRNCAITINSAIRLTDALFCGAVVHEVGHLLGHNHSRNPRSVMFPVLNARNVPHACR